MFEQLKIKIAIRQSIIWGIVLVIALFLVFTFNVTRMYSDVDRKLAAASEIKYYRFLLDGKEEINEGKNIGITTVFITRDGRVFRSDNASFDREAMMKIIEAVYKSKKGDGYLRIGGNRIAFLAEDNELGKAIYLCDFTEDFKRSRDMMMFTTLAGLVGIIAIALISVRWSKRTVAPVEDAFEKQQDLVANASHELKTPITIINTDLAILSDSSDNFTEDQKKWLNNIGTQVNRMSELVGEMLLLARLEAKGKDEPKEEVDLSRVTECVVLEAEVLAFEKNVTLITEIKPDIKICAVKQNIEKLIFILFENALKYTPTGGEVTVKVDGDKKKATISVRNTGEGIKKEDVPKLFDRFYRVDEAHSTKEGFGLGLSIAKSIVDFSGGKIGVNTEEGKYTEFIILLPTQCK